jgi:hypothetical protein
MCKNHPDRIALAYCSSCGKPLCTACVVRTSSANFCEACANRGDRPAKTRRAIPWWAVALAVLFLLLLVRTFVH